MAITEQQTAEVVNSVANVLVSQNYSRPDAERVVMENLNNANQGQDIDPKIESMFAYALDKADVELPASSEPIYDAMAEVHVKLHEMLQAKAEAEYQASVNQTAPEQPAAAEPQSANVESNTESTLAQSLVDKVAEQAGVESATVVDAFQGNLPENSELEAAIKETTIQIVKDDPQFQPIEDAAKLSAGNRAGLDGVVDNYIEIKAATLINNIPEAEAAPPLAVEDKPVMGMGLGR